jgi:hypothetical protein
MEFSFEVIAMLTLEHKKEDSNKSKHVATDLRLEVSPNLNRAEYLDEDDLPTKSGAAAMTVTLVQALVANIHHAHQKGFRDSADHLRYIMAELQKGFAETAIVQQGNMKNING